MSEMTSWKRKEAVHVSAVGVELPLSVLHSGSVDGSHDCNFPGAHGLKLIRTLFPVEARFYRLPGYLW